MKTQWMMNIPYWQQYHTNVTNVTNVGKPAIFDKTIEHQTDQQMLPRDDKHVKEPREQLQNKVHWCKIPPPQGKYQRQNNQTGIRGVSKLSCQHIYQRIGEITFHWSSRQAWLIVIIIFVLFCHSCYSYIHTYFSLLLKFRNTDG